MINYDKLNKIMINYEKFMKYDNAWFFVNLYVHKLKLIDTEKERKKGKEKQKEGNGIFMLTQFYFFVQNFLTPLAI